MSNFNDRDLFAWVYALTRSREKDEPIDPGDFATRRLESERWADFGCQPIATCCDPRRVSLAMAKGVNDDSQDRSEFTRESFGGI